MNAAVAHLIPDVVEVLESLEQAPGRDFSFVDGTDWCELENDARRLRLVLEGDELNVYLVDRDGAVAGRMAFAGMPAEVVAAAVHQLLQED